MTNGVLRKTTSRLLKAIAVLTGLGLLLFGGLATAIGVQKFVAAANKPGPADIAPAAQIIAIAIMFGVALLGAFFIWVGVRRGKRAPEGGVENPGPAEPEAQQSGRLIEECSPPQTERLQYEIKNAGPAEADTLQTSQLIGQCSPPQTEQLQYEIENAGPAEADTLQTSQLIGQCSPPQIERLQYEVENGGPAEPDALQTSRLIDQCSPPQDEQFHYHSENVPADVPESPQFGRFIAQCGPQQAGQTHYIVFGLGMLAFAGLCFVAPSTFLQPKPGDEKMIGLFSLLATGVSGLFGLVMLWGPLFGRAQKIFLYESGLLEQVGSSVRQIKLDQILHLRLQEWYEHRFAPQTLNVRVGVQGQRDLSFSSALKGDAKTIIAYLAERVANVEMVPFAY